MASNLKKIGVALILIGTAVFLPRSGYYSSFDPLSNGNLLIAKVCLSSCVLIGMVGACLWYWGQSKTPR